MLMKLIYTLLVICLFIKVLSCKISCKNEYNEDVDWYIGLKYPGFYDFVYLSSESKIQKWSIPKFNLSNDNNLVARTINQTLYAKMTSSMFAYYNDEKPSFQNSIERGHLKGVINFDNSSGFWLVHSVPKFPYIGKYEYGHSETMFAQSFICVSLNANNLKSIISQLLIMQSTVYDYYIPDNFSLDKETKMMLQLVVHNKNVADLPKSNVVKLKTANNLPLMHFAKSRIFAEDLYSGLVAPYLKASILVESWIRGDKIPSSCDGKYKVFNVKKVALPNKSFGEHDDHSKWVVSKDQNNPFICIGDINRMTSQFSRGGGTLCVCNSNIWKLFIGITEDYEHCSNYLEGFLPKFSFS